MLADGRGDLEGSEPPTQQEGFTGFNHLVPARREPLETPLPPVADGSARPSQTWTRGNRSSVAPPGLPDQRRIRVPLHAGPSVNASHGRGERRLRSILLMERQAAAFVFLENAFEERLQEVSPGVVILLR